MTLRSAYYGVSRETSQLPVLNSTLNLFREPHTTSPLILREPHAPSPYIAPAAAVVPPHREGVSFWQIVSDAKSAPVTPGSNNTSIAAKSCPQDGKPMPMVV